jgi:hypothetical protein
MSDGYSSTPNEKRPASQDTQASHIKSKRSKHRFFSRNKDASEVTAKDTDVEVIADAKAAEYTPVSFFSLFRSVLFTFKRISQPHLLQLLNSLRDNH